MKWLTSTISYRRRHVSLKLLHFSRTSHLFTTQNLYCFTCFELKIFRTFWSKKLRKRNFARHFMSLKLYLLVERLIISIDNFLKSKNRYIIWKKWFKENSPQGNSCPKNSHPKKSNSPWKTSLRKIATQKILTRISPPISLIVFLHLTLPFDKFSQT